ncbi:hypothetical protein KIH74_21415 [Kineosporia sp. J2-2]|uniref:Uncharacterized protein n=1 Tax=Kineosporia corallincola TaxID=2835133 RepID=A0ABS5TK87_9ACTN|nr:hypothetical protein [Kineosporia corallincola]MBT0771511.1 hypothetical protein [Kineosporia corallincola]
MRDFAVDAARNNAEWCAAVCRSHGVAGRFGPDVWSTNAPAPPFYPDVITLRPGVHAPGALSGIERENLSVKDSFADLDLTAHGLTVLFDARWIRRAAATPSPGGALRTGTVTTTAGLELWPGTPFRPGLLHEKSMRLLTFHHGTELAGGAALNRSATEVGVSNVFSTGTHPVWDAVVAAASTLFPGLPLVGYEHGDGLTAALAAGFTTTGPLRVWATPQNR